MRIITGSRGEPHITPQQDSLWHRGIQGTRDCVFEIGSKFAATRINDSTVSIADGTLSIQGRYACLLPGETEEVSIAPGRVDADRIDTICATITIDSGGLSEAAFEVIQGESGTDPEPPTIPSGDFDAGDNKAYFALYDVHLTGTTLDVITPKFGKYSPSIIDTELATELETKYGEQVLNGDRSINIKEWIKATTPSEQLLNSYVKIDEKTTGNGATSSRTFTMNKTPKVGDILLVSSVESSGSYVEEQTQMFIVRGSGSNYRTKIYHHGYKFYERSMTVNLTQGTVVFGNGRRLDAYADASGWVNDTTVCIPVRVIILRKLSEV